MIIKKIGGIAEPPVGARGHERLGQENRGLVQRQLIQYLKKSNTQKILNSHFINSKNYKLTETWAGMESHLNKLDIERKKSFSRRHRSNDLGKVGETINRSFIPIILSKLGFPLWYFYIHHVNANGVDFEGVIAGSLKRVIAEMNNFARISYIMLDRAILMEKAARNADYKLYIVSFEECVKPDVREYLEAHGWTIIILGYQLLSETYYVDAMQHGHPILLEHYEDHEIVEPLTAGVKDSLTPIYVATRKAPTEDQYDVYDDDYSLLQNVYYHDDSFCHVFSPSSAHREDHSLPVELFDQYN